MSAIQKAIDTLNNLSAVLMCADETGYVEDCGFVDIERVEREAKEAIQALQSLEGEAFEVIWDDYSAKNVLSERGLEWIDSARQGDMLYTTPQPPAVPDGYVMMEVGCVPDFVLDAALRDYRLVKQLDGDDDRTPVLAAISAGLLAAAQQGGVRD